MYFILIFQIDLIELQCNRLTKIGEMLYLLEMMLRLLTIEVCKLDIEYCRVEVDLEMKHLNPFGVLNGKHLAYGIFKQQITIWRSG